MNNFQQDVENDIDCINEGIGYNIFGEPIKYDTKERGVVVVWAFYTDGKMTTSYTEERGFTKWRYDVVGRLIYFYEEFTGIQNDWQFNENGKCCRFSEMGVRYNLANVWRFFTGAKMSRKLKIYYD